MGASELSRNSSGEKKTYLVARAKLQPIVLNKMYLLNGPNFKNGHPPDHFLDTFESKIPYPWDFEDQNRWAIQVVDFGENTQMAFPLKASEVQWHSLWAQQYLLLQNRHDATTPLASRKSRTPGAFNCRLEPADFERNPWRWTKWNHPKVLTQCFHHQTNLPGDPTTFWKGI